MADTVFEKGAITIVPPSYARNMSIIVRDDIYADTHDNARAKAVYEVIAALFGLEAWPVNEAWGHPILVRGADVEVHVERRDSEGRPDIVMVEAPLTIALSGQQAEQFMADLQNAQATL